MGLTVVILFLLIHCELYSCNIDKLDILEMYGYISQQNTVMLCVNCQGMQISRDLNPQPMLYQMSYIDCRVRIRKSIFHSGLIIGLQ